MMAGAFFGLFFHLGNLYWISTTMARFGEGIGRPTSVIILLTLVGYLSLYSTAFGGLAAAACTRGGAAAIFVSPMLWVGLEFFRKYPFGGFPWCLLGSSQVEFLPVVQITSLTGVHGVSLLIVLVNALFAYWLTRPGLRRALVAAAPVAALVGATLFFGYRELARPLPAASFPVAVVQGNVLQEHKWKPEYRQQIFATHMKLSAEGTEQGVRLVVWPESSTPFYFDGGPVESQHMRKFVKAKNVPFSSAVTTTSFYRARKITDPLTGSSSSTPTERFGCATARSTWFRLVSSYLFSRCFFLPILSFRVLPISQPGPTSSSLRSRVRISAPSYATKPSTLAWCGVSSKRALPF